MPNQGKAPMSGHTNQPGPSQDQATKRIAGPPKSAMAGNKMKSGGINRATQGRP